MLRRAGGGHRVRRAAQVAWSDVSQRFYVETLGCPKNQVDSDKLIGNLLADGLLQATEPEDADLVVVNTCAFIDAARQESIDTVLALDERRRDGARLVVTGCMAERYGDELAAALPEVDQVAGFGVKLLAPAPAGRRPLIPVSSVELPLLDLLNLPRLARRARGPTSRSPRAATASAASAPSRRSAVPSAAGPWRRSSPRSTSCRRREIVLVAQDLASYGKDVPDELGAGAIVPLVRAVTERADRVRLLYLYPSDLTDGLIDAVCDSGVPYFDLSLQHVSKPLLRRMRRWGTGPLPAPHRGHPPPGARRRVPQQLHRRVPGRDRARPRRAAALRRGGPARLVRVLLLQPRGRHVRRRPRRPGAGRADGRAPGRADRAPGRHHRASS